MNSRFHFPSCTQLSAERLRGPGFEVATDTLNRVKTKDPHFPYKGYECFRCGHVVVFDSIRTVLGHGIEDIAFAAYCNKECVDVLSSSYDTEDVFFSAMKVLGGTLRYPKSLNILLNTFLVFPDDDEPPYFF